MNSSVCLCVRNQRKLTGKLYCIEVISSDTVCINIPITTFHKLSKFSVVDRVENSK